MRNRVCALLIVFTVFVLIGYLGIGCSEDIAGTERNLCIISGQNGTILTTNDGITWSRVKTLETTDNLNAIAYGNDLWVAVGGGGTIITSDDNGSTWTTQDSGTTNSLNDVTYGKDKWVAVGWEGVIVTSTDGSKWEQRKINVGSIRNILRAVAYGKDKWGGDLWIAVGGPLTERHNGIIINSANGIHWVEVSFWGKSSESDSSLHSIAYSNNLWVAVGTKSVIFTSIDGDEWKTKFKKILGITSLSDVNYMNRLWVATGWNGAIITSTHAGVWKEQNQDPEANYTLNDAAYGNGKWTVVGERGTIVTSTDGRNWRTGNLWLFSKLNSIACH